MSRLILWSLPLFLACNASKNCAQHLQNADQALLSKTDLLIQQSAQMTPSAYLDSLKNLRAEETKLFESARACDFGDDQTSYNYWYRARLKFPSRLQQELDRIERR